MQETTWLTCTEPMLMLQQVRSGARDRELRLFACACCRRVWHLLTDPRSRRAVELAEQYAIGSASEQDLALAASEADTAALLASGGSVSAVADARSSAAFAALNATQADAFRAADYSAANVASAAYHTASSAGLVAAAARQAERAAQAGLAREIFGNPFRPFSLDEAVRAWNGGTVGKLARAIITERDFAQMAVLADALEEAGCTDLDIVAHCRQAGKHVLGCWVLRGLH